MQMRSDRVPAVAQSANRLSGHDLVADVTATVLQPTVDELARRGTPFVGLLYAGLALIGRGVRVIEFNARFGDPETQPLLTRLITPLGGVLYAAANGSLASEPELEWATDAAVGVLVDQIEARFADAQREMSDPDIFADRQRAAAAGRNYRQLEAAAKLAEAWRRAVDDEAGAREMLAEEENAEVREMPRGELPDALRNLMPEQ